MTQCNNAPKKGIRFFGLEKLTVYIRRYGRQIASMIVLNMFVSVIDTAMPLFQRYALNRFVGDGNLSTLPLFIVAYAAAVVASGFLVYFGCRDAMQIEVSVDRDLRNAAFDHLQTLSFSYYNQNSVGYIHARVMSDTSRIGSLVSWTLMDAVSHSTYLIGSIAVMLIVNAKLALLTISVVPLLAVIFSVFQKKLIILRYY